MGILTVTGDEIEQVTRKKRRQAQAKVLKALGIRLQIRPDGTLLVFRTSLGIPHQEPRAQERGAENLEGRYRLATPDDLSARGEGGCQGATHYGGTG